MWIIINQNRKQKSGTGLGTYLVQINLWVYLIKIFNSWKSGSENQLEKGLKILFSLRNHLKFQKKSSALQAE